MPVAAQSDGVFAIRGSVPQLMNDVCASGGFTATDLAGDEDTGGQCRVERCFRIERTDTSGQYVALKTVALSLGLPVVTAITHHPVQRCALITAQ